MRYQNAYLALAMVVFSNDSGSVEVRNVMTTFLQLACALIRAR
jgi:hypothetical protein